MEELEKKKKELKKQFDERIKEIKEDKIKEIINSFKLTEEKFCLEEISKFDNKKINELIINLFKNEIILKNILFNLNIFIEKIKDKIRNVEHLNTILVGPSGVGKSTLINSILELETQTVTGFGQPQTEELKLKINYDVKTVISKMNEKSEFEDLYKENINIILDIFYKFIFLNPDIKIADYKKPEVNFGENKYMISMQSQAIIKDFVIDYFKESLSSYEKNLNAILSNHTKELCNEIISFQMEFNQQNDNLLKTPWTSIELGKIIKKYLHDNLAEKAKLANLKNSFSYISSPIIQKFGEYFINSYNKGMTRPEFIKKANDVIKIPFNKIEKQIKDYNEMLKKKKLEDSQEMAPTPLAQNQTTQKPTPESTPEKDLEGLSWED